MKFSQLLPKRAGDPIWVVRFTPKSKLKTLTFRAPTEGLAVRKLLRDGVNVKLIEKLAQVGVGFITFLFTSFKN